jgi:Secretion system C-terminal sorting domain
MKKLLQIIAFLLVANYANAQFTFICAGDTIPYTIPIIATGGITVNSSVPLPASMSGVTIIVDANGTLNIDVSDTWTGCKIVMLEDSRITVSPGVTLTLQACTFVGCDRLWKGIDVLAGGALDASQNEFRDAKAAIEFRTGCGTSTVIGNIFTNNYLGIYRRASILSSFPVTINYNNFSNSSATGLLKPAIGILNPNTYFAGLGLLSTTYNTHSFAGIYIQYASTLLADIDDNRFTEMNNGAILYKCQSTTFNRNQFLEIKRKYTTGTVFGIGIYNDGFAINNNLLAVNGSNAPSTKEFENCNNGIKNIGANLTVFRNKFLNTKFSCVLNNSGINLRNNIIVDSNNMKSFTDYGVYSTWTAPSQTPVVKIRGNIISMNNLMSMVSVKTAIHAEGPSFAGSNTFQALSNSTIHGNTIAIPNASFAKAGIVVKWMIESRVIKNNITISTALNTVGIDLTQLTNNNTSCNRITGIIPFTPISTTGIRATSPVSAGIPPPSIIRCNTIVKMRRCILITGTTTTPLALVANEMTNGVQGIEITTFANIGNQVLTGNAWLGTTWLAGTGKLLCTASPLTFTCTSPGALSPSPLVSAGVDIPSTLVSMNCQAAPQCSNILFKTDETDNTVIDIYTPTEMITVYPNPATTSINITNVAPTNSSDVFIYNLQGKLVLQTPTIGAYQNIGIDALPLGTYLLKVIVNNEIIIKKFIKQ